MKKNLKITAAFAVALLVSSQVFAKGSKKQKEAELVESINKAFAEGDYATCLSMIRSKKDRKKNVILNSLDMNMLMHLNENYLDSGKAFLGTQRLMQQSLKDTAGGKKAGAAMSNETATKYTGNMYERILVYTMRAVNALSLGDVGNAKGVIDNYTGDYKDIIAPLIAEQKALAEEDEDNTEDAYANGNLKKAGLSVDRAAMNSGKPPKSTKVYENSPFLQYLSAVVYSAHAAAEGQGIEHAEKAASELKTLNPNVDVSEDVAVPAGKGRIDVVALSGIIGKRTENDFPATPLGLIDGIPIMVKFAYPVFGPQNHAISAVRVTLSDGTTKTATLVEDFDEAVKTDVEFKASGAFSRSFTRNLVKIGGAIVALESAKVANEANNNKMTQMALTAAQIALPKTVDLFVNAEKADVRQGAYFPHKASAAGFTVEPGTYSVTVEYLSGGTVVETKELSNIVVSAGKPTVVVSSCAK